MLTMSPGTVRVIFYCQMILHGIPDDVVLESDQRQAVARIDTHMFYKVEYQEIIANDALEIVRDLQCLAAHCADSCMF